MTDKMPQALKERYAHDCTSCTFLERSLVEGRIVDWYHCPGILGGSIIGRTGNEPWDYWSMPSDMVRLADLKTSNMLRQANRVLAAQVRII
jgi:hypothetical protein